MRKRLIILLVLLLMAGGAGLIFWQYDRYHQFSSYQVSWERSLADESQEGALSSEGSFCGYVDFADGVLKYTKDGASYIDNQGDTIWVQSYEMNTPIVSVNGEYAVVADRQGTSMYICNTDGCQGQAAALLPILQVSVSAHGVVRRSRRIPVPATFTFTGVTDQILICISNPFCPATAIRWI